MGWKAKVYIDPLKCGDFCEGCFERDINPIGKGYDDDGEFWLIDLGDHMVSNETLSRYPVSKIEPVRE